MRLHLQSRDADIGQLQNHSQLLPALWSHVPNVVEARRLKHECPPTLNQSKKEHRHKPSKVHVPTFWRLLYVDIVSYTSDILEGCGSASWAATDS